MSNIDVFISHSSNDAHIAEALIDLLRAALSIPAERIRCTSINGFRLPVGASTEDHLRREVHDAKVFIGLITPTSLKSAYVLFELGARWGAHLHLAPVLASGIDVNDLRGPLSMLNALRCDSSAQIYQLISDVASLLEVNVGSPAAYQRQVQVLVQNSQKRPVVIQQWINTNQKDIRVGLSSPIHKLVVHETPIEANGRIVGLPKDGSAYHIQGFIITNKEYPQGSALIDENGYWRIKQIHLGATSHTVFFRLYDEASRCIAESEKITVIKEDITP